MKKQIKYHKNPKISGCPIKKRSPVLPSTGLPVAAFAGLI
jgi:hypothetical protein